MASSMWSHEDESRTAKSWKQRLEHTNIDGNTKSRAAEIAHLVLHAPNCANLHGDMVSAMAGMSTQAADADDEELKCHRSMSLVHGVLTKNYSTSKMEHIPSSGVKHNRVKVACVLDRGCSLTLGQCH